MQLFLQISAFIDVEYVLEEQHPLPSRMITVTLRESCWHRLTGFSGIFPPVYIRTIGAFQDGGLGENDPVGTARRVSRHIWPYRKAPALVAFTGTETEEDGAQSQAVPHFRNVSKNGFARRALNAWLSSLDGETKWRDKLNRLHSS